MVVDVFGLHGRPPTDQEIDRGAEALRDREQGGRLLRDWNGLRPSEKRKWIDRAKVVLLAALDPHQKARSAK